ncbi:hypothetical protein M979_3273 [Buttiauxella noackiae ATCC 51607]|uniref:Inner membrane protein n=1 Tax=Buttiauxella noackiae ATCC 51607 TaxID=1354255 RepID=A0A1B7HJP2_9ENTR|nr:hypothetical protein [Buttiauxella noackiae]OAT15825.1 hypothetical protein M979_3273 [Buttiauxella noackiae ATCC 51607]
MFKFEIIVFIDAVLFPALVVGFGVLWAHLFPEYYVPLTFITFIILLWLFPEYGRKKKTKSKNKYKNK